jgi:hypothetical protein
MAGKSSTPKAGTYADGGYPASEYLTDMNEGHGFTVGDRVEFVVDFADDVPAGRRGVVERIDNHPTMPITVFVHANAGGFFFTPVKPDEIAKVNDEQPAEDAVSVPETAPEGSTEGEGDAAPVAA